MMKLDNRISRAVHLSDPLLSPYFLAFGQTGSISVITRRL